MPEQTTEWSDCLQHAAITDIGMRRSNNQDSHAVTIAADDPLWRQRGHVFLVADGMGAHAAGELASDITAQGVPHLYLKYRDQSAPEALQRAVIETNTEVNRRGRANEEFHNMGTTCSVLTLLPQGAVVAHVGDSRVYRLRGNNLEQLTFDHSLVWEMRAAGTLSDNDELSHMIPKNVITRSLGPNPSVKVDVEGPFPIEVGDTFLLCSDGLTGPVADDELAPIVATFPPKEAAQVLVDLANLRGGPDNVTIIIAKVTGPRMATNETSESPIRLGGGARARTNSHPVMLALMGACFLAAAGMAVLQSWVAAGVAAIGGLACLATIGYQRFSQRPSGTSLRSGQRFGRGPYTKTACMANSDFVDKLADTIRQLREAAIEKNWDIDWPTLDGYCQQAEGAAGDRRYTDSMRHYARGISFVMQQLRQRKKTSDSSIDLTK